MKLGEAKGTGASAIYARGILLTLAAMTYSCMGAASSDLNRAVSFPVALDAYTGPGNAGLWEVLRSRIQQEPFNLVATSVFFLAIVHTFLAPFFTRLSHRFEEEHRARLKAAGGTCPAPNQREEVSFKAEIFHFLGEVEAIFGIWVLPLLLAVTFRNGFALDNIAASWSEARNYISHRVNFTEPMFVVVIMAIAASRPILKFSERIMAMAAGLGKGSPAAWWLSILTIGPLLGSFITEPAAMTISALLLADKIYRYRPSLKFAYATLGLLFVNVSVGGTLTHFAAPPVLMVAAKWGWGLQHMLIEFGWKAIIGIVVANGLYLVYFRRDLDQLRQEVQEDPLELDRDARDKSVPAWITVVHLLFLAWTVFNNHYPALFIGGFLFYLAFTRATEHHQSNLALRPALLVGFFLAGLVVHGGLQGWWIAPVLSRLSEVPLFAGAVVLTAFNDNAAITYLATLVPDFTAQLQYVVVAGAVTGGGLTVIANAPNPAGQSILSRFFPDGVSPIRLLFGAALPTVVMSLAFLLFR